MENINNFIQNLDPKVVNIVIKVVKIAVIIIIAKIIANKVTKKPKFLQKLANKTDKDMNENMQRAVAKACRAFIYTIAAFLIISELEFDISGLVTGLGLSGVIITLAAQDTVKSLLGGVAIILDKPYQLGDYIVVDKYEGTVEEIKFRSTAIRTLDNSILHIPNSEMSTMSIVNCSKMQKRRYYTKLVVELDTPLEKLEDIKNKIEQMLMQNQDVIKDSIIVKFQEISDNGMDVVVIAYINKTKFVEFLEVKEQINYEIMNILRNENVELAYNTQTMYIKNA